MTHVTVIETRNGQTYRSQWIGYDLNHVIDMIVDWVECLGRWEA